MSRDLLRLLLAQMNLFGNMAPLLITFWKLQKAGGYIISEPSGPLKSIFKTGTKFKNRSIRRLGTGTKFRCFTLSINYSAKPGHRC